MPKLIELLEKNKITLLVDLSKNEVELASAASLAGADVIQLHIAAKDLKNAAARENLKRIIKDSKVPIGAALSHKESFGPKMAKEITSLGFDYVNSGIEHLSPPLLKVEKISKVLTLNSRYSLDEIVTLSDRTFQALVAAIIPTSDHGKNLIVGDLQRYISIVLSSGVPVIIPTQRKIHPSEIAIIGDAGVAGILLTPQVTGKTAKHIEKAVREFRTGVDNLAE